MTVFNLTLGDSAAAQYRPCNDSLLTDGSCLGYDGEHVTLIRFDMPTIHSAESVGTDETPTVACLVVLGDFAAMSPEVAARLHGIVGGVSAHEPSLTLMGMGIGHEPSRVYLIWQGTEAARLRLKGLLAGNQVELFGSSAGMMALCETEDPTYQPIDAHGLRNLLIAEIRSKGAADCNLAGVDLCCGDLSGVNFANANLSGANLQGVKLCGANLDGANLNLSRLSDVDFSGATLVGAKLIGAKVIGANLSDANLTRANLSNANFSKANLTRTNLDRTKMTAARFVYSRGLSRDEQAALEQRRGAIF